MINISLNAAESNKIGSSRMFGIKSLIHEVNAGETKRDRTKS